METTQSIPQPTAASTPGELAIRAAPATPGWPPRIFHRGAALRDLSGDPDQDYFADGILEDLTTDLSRVSGCFVIARNAAFHLQGKKCQHQGDRLIFVMCLKAPSDEAVFMFPARRAPRPAVICGPSGSKQALGDLLVSGRNRPQSLANQLRAHLVNAEARHAERAPHPNSTDLLSRLSLVQQRRYSRIPDAGARLFRTRLGAQFWQSRRVTRHGPVDAILGSTF